MKCLLGLLICSCILAGEEVLTPAEKEFTSSMEALKKDYDKKANTIREKFVTALKAQLTELTKKGDFDGAVKVKEKINKATIAQLVGKWDVDTTFPAGSSWKNVVIISLDGTVQMQGDSGKLNDNNKITIVWVSRHIWTFTSITTEELLCESVETDKPETVISRHILRRVK